YDSALYIEIHYANYGIGALTFTTNPNFSVFDEIVASTKGSGANLIKNGNSIVSITTGGNVIDTSGSSFNTYLNKTAYGRTYGETNANARYYYNIAYARANVSTAKYKFLVWSVKTYAHESLSAWFDTGASGNTFTGSLDMTGLSYYPIDLTGSVAFTNAAIKLDNITMQAAVKYAYYYDDGGVQSSDTRSVRTADNQHYLMHAALFNDVSGTITVNTATVSGNVPKLSDNFCGFLVAGTLGGKDEVKAKCNLNAITFDGVYISVGDDKIDDTRYAPLFINKVGKNSTIDWAGASQTSAYSSFAVNGKYAASSIIGNVGDASARAIYLTFTGFKFDARTSATAVDNFDSVYGTEKSVFGRATILNSFVYFAESSGSYNFGMEEDRTSSVSATHDVVYGKEITSSSENPSKQKKYYGSEYYVHPTAFESATEYDFSTGLYLPYVFIAYNLGEYKHELSVNITFSSVIEGCGKYGDPFVIDDDDKLPIISSIISGGDVGNTVQLYLPSDLTDYDYTDTDYTKYLYNFGTSSFTPSNGGTAQANADVRRYLAGAYYVITKDITLPKKYVALGTATSAEYAFRGVIIGRGNPVVENNSINPLIYSSNGSVIKDITVNVKVEYDSSDVIELAAPQGDNTYEYSSGIQAYGAVIGQILGGDNFIDGVQVRFTAATFSITAKSSSYYPRLTPIGGYVGVVVNGGLVFRNMTSENVGLTALTCDKVSDNSGYLYVNPIIGRVIAGYAFHETNAYAVNSATLDNGNKNYVISDLSPSAGKLNVAYTNSSTFTITVPDGQAVFVLGAIVNSGAASATYDTDNATTEQPYDTDTLTDFWQAYRAHTTARADATYGFVGAAAEEGYAADFAKAGDDVYTDNATKVPYIIRVYSNETDGVYLARCISTKTDNVITVSGACDVAAGFRGIG
ncbi:MAG: hypothetical protein J6Y43_04080, partial [Clostridia bacterium]|nr:hypothetical protein [Clostridia bacterium]